MKQNKRMGRNPFDRKEDLLVERKKAVDIIKDEIAAAERKAAFSKNNSYAAASEKSIGKWLLVDLPASAVVLGLKSLLMMRD